MLRDEERLQKVLSYAGILSRRKAEEAIVQGLVTVNGLEVRELGAKVKPYQDKICYLHQKVKLLTKQKRVWAINKPRSVICANKDPQGRTTIRSMLPEKLGHIYPVGRLDYNSEGLILMTNDGELANRLLHPKYGLEKIYRVKIKGKLDAKIKERFLRGIKLEDGRAKFENMYDIEYDEDTDKTWITVVVHEGRNRMIRRMFEKYGVLVDRLRRIQIGAVELGSLKTGKAQELDEEQLIHLYEYCKLEF